MSESRDTNEATPGQVKRTEQERPGCPMWVIVLTNGISGALTALLQLPASSPHWRRDPWLVFDVIILLPFGAALGGLAGLLALVIGRRVIPNRWEGRAPKGVSVAATWLLGPIVVLFVLLAFQGLPPYY
jgi:hypothetical protein